MEFQIDEIKRKRMLLDVTTVLTDGSLNGIPYRVDSPHHRNGQLDMERLFIKTAHELNIALPKTENDLKREQLLIEMKEYEQKLLTLKLDNVNLDLEETQVKELIKQHEEKSLTLEQLSDNPPSSIRYKSLAEISPFDFKADLMETTNWHLYYKKLSQIRHFTRDRSTWPYFNQVFMVSAKQNKGISAIRVRAFHDRHAMNTTRLSFSDISSHARNPHHGCFIETLLPISIHRKSLKCVSVRRCSNIYPKRFLTTIFWFAIGIEHDIDRGHTYF
jgi:hypothetical protein